MVWQCDSDRQLLNVCNSGDEVGNKKDGRGTSRNTEKERAASMQQEAGPSDGCALC